MEVRSHSVGKCKGKNVGFLFGRWMSVRSQRLRRRERPVRLTRRGTRACRSALLYNAIFQNSRAGPNCVCFEKDSSLGPESRPPPETSPGSGWSLAVCALTVVDPFPGRCSWAQASPSPFVCFIDSLDTGLRCSLRTRRAPATSGSANPAARVHRLS